MNVLFISNSTCYYFRDELYGILTAAGYEDVTLALVYYGGCPLEKHWKWLQEGAANYDFRVWDKCGEHSTKDYSLEAALQFKNWDIISFDNNARSFASGDVQTSLEQSQPWFEKLYSYIKPKFPDSRYFWHEVWAKEMKDKVQRSRVYNAKKGVMQIIQKTYGVEVVPTGDAWEKVRDLELFTKPLPCFPEVERFSLCSRLCEGAFMDDYSHDGDIGGGQYLNACVWFEIITGESCIGNTFRPQYLFGDIDCSLTEEKIEILQKAAHDAVTQRKAQR